MLVVMPGGIFTKHWSRISLAWGQLASGRNQIFLNITDVTQEKTETVGRTTGPPFLMDHSAHK